MREKIKEYLLSHAENNKEAIVDGEKRITYRDLIMKSKEVSEQIKTVLESRSHIIVVIPNSIEYVVAFSAIILSDNVVVPVYAKSSVQEIENTVDYCDAAMIITDSKNLEHVLKGEFSHRILVLNIDSMKMTETGNPQKEFSIASPETVRVMIGTSGSVDLPKRAMLTDENLISNSLDTIAALDYSENERIMVLMPFSFIGGTTPQMLVPLILGATMYIYHGPLYPEHFFNTIEKYGITSTSIVPSVLRLMVEENKDFSEKTQTLRYICFGGGRTDEDTFQKMKASPLCDKYVHVYGQTEASPRISQLFFRSEKDKLPSVGRALEHVDVKIDIDSADGKSGEILARGKNIMAGYYRSDYSPIEDGWLRTGDIGYIDEDGYIYVTGRKKNLIIYAGMNIFPEEVEVVIKQCDQVKEALVYGEKNKQYGEIPVAKVELKKPGDLTEADLKEFCKKRLSYYKVPVKFIFVDSLKRTYSGKIVRKAGE